jgi:hypothetical protein
MTATTTLLAPPNQRYELKWAKSKKLLESFIDQYNTDRPLREQLRQAHRDLAEALLFFYSVALKSQQAYVAPLQEGDLLPCLRANNVQLAEKMNCSERTIINLRRRLAAAGITVFHEWHGTNSQFTLMLNPAILHLQTATDPTNLVEKFQAPSFPKNCMAQSLRHTVTSTILVTNQLIELGGAPNQQRAINQDFTEAEHVGQCLGAVEKPENVVGLPQSGREPDTEPGTIGTGYTTSSDAAGYTPPVAAAPPRAGFQRQGFGSRLREKMGATPPPAEPNVGNSVKTEPNVGNLGIAPPAPAPQDPPAPSAMAAPPTQPPRQIGEVLDGLSPDQVRSIQGYINIIYTAAMVNLYADKYIHEEEEARARALLAEYFRYAKPERWSAGTNEILERIILVKKWIVRGQKEGQNRWVPLPSLYFDLRNPNGFTRTKSWYKLHIVKRSEIKTAELLTKAFNTYIKSLEPGSTRSPEETYRSISQKLGKKDQILLDQFNRKILEYRHAS